MANANPGEMVHSTHRCGKNAGTDIHTIAVIDKQFKLQGIDAPCVVVPSAVFVWATKETRLAADAGVGAGATFVLNNAN